MPSSVADREEGGVLRAGFICVYKWGQCVWSGCEKPPLAGAPPRRRGCTHPRPAQGCSSFLAPGLCAVSLGKQLIHPQVSKFTVSCENGVRAVQRPPPSASPRRRPHRGRRGSTPVPANHAPPREASAKAEPATSAGGQTPEPALPVQRRPGGVHGSRQQSSCVGSGPDSSLLLTPNACGFITPCHGSVFSPQQSAAQCSLSSTRLPSGDARPRELRSGYDDWPCDSHCGA